MASGFHVLCPLFLSNFNENWIFSTVFRKILKYQIWSKSSSVSRVVPCGQTDGGTGITKLIVDFIDFAQAPKTVFSPFIYQLSCTTQ